jgi:hypothetical protein
MVVSRPKAQADFLFIDLEGRDGRLVRRNTKSLGKGTESKLLLISKQLKAV